MTRLDPIALLQGAVAIPSVSGDERAVVEYLADVMTGLCHRVEVDAVGNVVGTWGGGQTRVWLLGHVDTVPGHVDVRVSDGVLHGRGAVDAKGSFCAFVAALALLPAAVADAVAITVIGAVGEEAPLSVGASHALASLPRPELVIVGEPSGWQGITLGYKGSLQLELRVEAGMRHSAVDEPTVAERLVACYNGAREYVTRFNAAAAGGVFDALQLRLLALNTHDDGLGAAAHARLALRLPPGAEPTPIAEALLDLAASAGVAASVVPGAVRAYRAAKDGPLPAALRAAIRAAGGTPRHTLKTGTSDMNVAAAAWHGGAVPAMVAYGPGDSTLDHTPDERIDLAEYRSAIAVLAHALRSVAAAPGS